MRNLFSLTIMGYQRTRIYMSMRGRLYTDVAGKLQEGVATVGSAGSAFYIRTDLVFLIQKI